MEDTKNLEINISEFISNVVETSDLVAFGETKHGDHNQVFQLFTNNMSRFTGIFLETPVSLQSSIDNYLENEVFNERLEQMFAGAEREGKDIRTTFNLLLDCARVNGLKVVCIDSSKIETNEYFRQSPFGYYWLSGESRNEDMFTNVSSDFVLGKKWVLIGGSQHIKVGVHHRSGDFTLGKRLKDKVGNNFFSICLVKKESYGQIDFYSSNSQELQKILSGSDNQLIDESGNNYFDGYIVHS